MELSVSSPNQSVLLSTPDSMSDPEEREISDDEDDDRNHKHRRKEETRSQNLEQDSSDQGFSRPYRKNYTHLENGIMFSEHEKRSLGGASGQRVQLDSQRLRSNSMFSRDSAPGRGRGNYGSWTQRDSRFNHVDLSSHLVQVGSMAPGIFGGRGLAGVSAAQNAPWPAFGMIPGVGALDGFHHLQGSLRPPLNAPLNMGIPRQRCRDFEERGFCLRGDMCPMEHGINRIVVDDVQSLSQFNLPVSAPVAPHLASSSKPVPAQFGCANVLNTKGAHGTTNEGGMAVDVLGYGDTYSSGNGPDFYDPDQPLWNNSAGETSGALSAINSRGIEENIAPLEDNNQDGAENASGIRDSRNTSQSSWGRMCGSGSQANFKEKGDEVLNSSAGHEDRTKEVSVNLSRHGKQKHGGEKVVDSSNVSNDAMNNARKPSQKAMRTLFVNYIPHESNKRDLILAHFQKFGKVIDIHIPLNSERAFVQFSKREEAESALRAPDAVMGNRFIKLWWANRDSIPDNGLSIGNSALMKSRGLTASGGQNQLPTAAASKSNHLSSFAKEPAFHAGGLPSSFKQPKAVVATSGPKVTPLQQKKAETLERLKETLRKKQEMLEQKRNEYRKKMATLEKQGTVVKGEEAGEPDAKRVKVDTESDSAAASTSPKSESSTDKKMLVQNQLFTAKRSTGPPLPDSNNLKQRAYSFTTGLNTPMTNRYKLDNRTTTIKVVPPLPTGLADVAVLREHFSSYGEVSKLELEDNASSTDNDKKHETYNENRAACVTFVKRSAAEKAFANAKCWREHMLQLMWVTRQSNTESNSKNSNNNLSVSVDHRSSKNKCTSSVCNGPTPAAEVKASTTEELEKTNVFGDDSDTVKETKETNNGNNKSNSELMEGASEAIAASRTDEDKSEHIDG